MLVDEEASSNGGTCQPSPAHLPFPCMLTTCGFMDLRWPRPGYVCSRGTWPPSHRHVETIPGGNRRKLGNRRREGSAVGVFNHGGCWGLTEGVGKRLLYRCSITMPILLDGGSILLGRHSRSWEEVVVFSRGLGLFFTCSACLIREVVAVVLQDLAELVEISVRGRGTRCVKLGPTGLS